MRAWHRGTREMDLILGQFADLRLEGFDADALDAFEALLAEDDHDLYRWVAGTDPAPPRHAALIADIAASAAARADAGVATAPGTGVSTGKV